MFKFRIFLFGVCAQLNKSSKNHETFRGKHGTVISEVSSDKNIILEIKMLCLIYESMSGNAVTVGKK